MTEITAILVSKRAHLAAMASLGLLFAAMLVSLSDCHEQPLPMGSYFASQGL